MSYNGNPRPAYNHIRPVILPCFKKQWLLRNHIDETTPSASELADKPSPWPVALSLSTALLVMGIFHWLTP